MAKAAIANLRIQLTAVTSQFSTGIQKSEKQLQRFGQRARKTNSDMQLLSRGLRGLAAPLVGLAAGLTAGSVLRGLNEQLKLIDELGKAASRLGTSASGLRGLQHAATQSGATAEQLNTALEKMNIRIAQAAQGTGPAVDALDELGLSASNLLALSPEERFGMIADALNKVGNQADKARIAQALFEEGGLSLLNTLALGSEGLRKLREEADKLGPSLDNNATKAAADARDAMDRFEKSLDGVKQQLAIGLTPALEDSADAFTKWATAGAGAAAKVEAALLGVEMGLRAIQGTAGGALSLATFGHSKTGVKMQEDANTAFQRIANRFNELQGERVAAFFKGDKLSDAAMQQRRLERMTSPGGGAPSRGSLMARPQTRGMNFGLGLEALARSVGGAVEARRAQERALAQQAAQELTEPVQQFAEAVQSFAEEPTFAERDDERNEPRDPGEFRQGKIALAGIRGVPALSAPSSNPVVARIDATNQKLDALLFAIRGGVSVTV